MNVNKHELKTLLAEGETLTIEFKSDVKGLPDRDLVAAVVAMANTEGGLILLGVEDDGIVTGVQAVHQDTAGLMALVANRTNPSTSVVAEIIEWDNSKIIKIQVPKSRSIVSTSEGLLLRRRLMASGKPEAMPFYPHEFIQRQSAMGLIDPSAMPMEQISVQQLDSLQRLRIRNAIKKYGGDQSLLPLADEELDGSLGLTVDVHGQRRPTVAGLMLLGTEELLRRHLPAYETAFQVLRGTNVLVNEFFRKPLLETFETIELLFNARVTEEEIQVGLFRVPIPNFDRRAFREALVNALVHRDFSRLGAVHVRLDDDGLAISNPGGFVEGVTLDNLLVADPRSRNPLLADTIKRIGLAERTGRGIDRIFEGMLRYGRPAPDYSMTDAYTVSVRMHSAETDLEFLRMVITQEEKSGDMPIDTLIILSRLRQERRLTTATLAADTQKSEQATRTTLEKLVEAGLIDALGTGRGRTYTLSAKVYRHTGQVAAYVRQVGFDHIQQEQMVLKYIDKNGSIKRADVMDLCRITKDQAYKLLIRLKSSGQIVQIGSQKGALYKRKR
jgi:ATP-dependent DNA helicase RecG